MNQTPNAPRASRNYTTLQIVAAYVFTAGAWILLSDRVLEVFVTDAQSLTAWQTYKGWLFVAATAGLLYVLISRRVNFLKRAEQTMGESERHLRMIVETEPECVTLLDIEGRLRDVNPAGLHMIEAESADQVLGQPFVSLVAPKHRAAVVELIESVLGGQERTLQFEVVSLKGSRLWVEKHAAPLRDGDEHVAGVLAVTRDITESRRAVEEQRRLITLIENTPDFISLATLEGRVQFINQAGRRLVGLGGDSELATLSIPELVNQEDARLLGEITEANRQGRSWEGEIRLTHLATGEAVLAEVRAFPVLDARTGQPTALAAVCRDLRERRRAEQELAAKDEQLRQSQKMEAVGKLAGGIAHDFNNMMTAVIGYANLTLRRLPTDDPLRRNVQEIIKAAERSAALTRQLLAFSRKQVLQPKAFDLNLTVREMNRLLHRLIGEDVEMVTTPAPWLHQVMADPGQIEQVIVNLAVNARDAMPGGGRLFIETANVEFDGTEEAAQQFGVSPGRYVRLRVTDTGTGMDAETRARIFEPFFTTKEVGKGTGLGLSTVYGIVKQHGGYITVESAPGRGTTFDLYLPPAEGWPDEEASGVAAASREAPEPLRGTETVLVVEDEPTLRDIARELLELYGYRVLLAPDGRAALSACGQMGEEPVHLVITDVVMPGMSGPELARRLRALRPEMKIIYMSGYTDDAIVRHGVLDAAGVAFLQKPFTPDELARKVRQILDESK
ncbi:MAG: PAS domain S-box protein [Pyrinomonadaceae bacterium]